ncbi:GNAT family N-acetyltransferase [Ruminococcus sp. 5_1_39BFAA]|uniref:GNAT family N-acetyltransferase n=1 Tax=Ruminococcus sp. 5_1_39BFAA TaxID=457412 RepID=UPI0035650990
MKLYDVFKDGKKYKEKVYELYQEAFPEEEKKPVGMLEELARRGMLEILAVVDDEGAERFVGLAINMTEPSRKAPEGEKETALLDYFAISPDVRGGGYGSKALKLLLERFSGKTYIFEVEMRDEAAPNAAERQRRVAFYLRGGLKETGLFVHAYDTDFEILTPDGKVTYEQYVGFLTRVMGEAEMRQVVNPTLLRKNA